MKKSGFTLVEIAVVTIILGLLATLGSLAIMKSVQNSRIKTAEAELEMISAAVLQLAWDTGKWPNGQPRTDGGSEEKWDISVAGCGLLDTDGNYNNWKGPYYGGAINDPWGNPYFFDPDYEHKEKGGSTRDAVVVGSFGPSGTGKYDYDSNNIIVFLDD